MDQRSGAEGSSPNSHFPQPPEASSENTAPNAAANTAPGAGTAPSTAAPAGASVAGANTGASAAPAAAPSVDAAAAASSTPGAAAGVTAGTAANTGAGTSANAATYAAGTSTNTGTMPSAAAATPLTKKQGFKVFILGFLGALVACLIALGVSSALNQGSSSVVLGSDGSGTTITVNGEDTTLAEVVAQKVLPTVVNINVYTATSQNPMQQFMSGESSDEEYQQSSLGSGVILSADGYILTNYHVIEDADKLQVVATGGEYDATVVGTDPSSDLAVIKIEASDLSAAEIGSSSDLVTGEWVMAVGSPFGLEQSVSTGIVSATSRSSSSLYSSESEAVYTNMIQTDAAINPGNSGGALVDKDGKLIGINTLIASSSGTSSGVGFAIPIDYAMQIADQIIAGEKPSHAQLGVSLSTVNSQIASRYDLPVDSGAYVASVSANSGAANAGIEEGDIIVKVDDTEITSADDLIIAVRSHSPGDKISVTYYHGSEEKTTEVELGKDS